MAAAAPAASAARSSSPGGAPVNPGGAPVNEVKKASSASGAGCGCCCSWVCSNRGGGLGLSDELLTSEAVETEGAVT